MHIPGNAEIYLHLIISGTRIEISPTEVVGVGYQRDPLRQAEAHWPWRLPWAVLKASVVPVRIQIQAQIQSLPHIYHHCTHDPGLHIII